MDLPIPQSLVYKQVQVGYSHITKLGIFNTKAPFLASFPSQSLRRVVNISKDFWIPSS